MPGAVAYTPTKQDYVDALRLCMRAQTRGRGFRTRLLLSGLGMGTVMGALFSYLEGDVLIGMTSGLVLGLIGIVAALAIILFNHLLLPRRGGRLFEQDRSMAAPIEFEWDEERTGWRTGYGSFRAAWRDHHRWAADRRALLFFANDQLYRYVPATALAPEQRGEIERLLSAHGVPRL